MISIIVAIAEKNAIGKDNELLCHIPGDLKRFKNITSGKTVIMGLNTFKSLPKGPLPNRRNIVITNLKGQKIEGCDMAYSIEEAVEMCNADEENFIIGGGSIYRQFLPLADKLYITKIHHDFNADTFFPEIDYSQWKLIESEKITKDVKYPFSYLTYLR